MPWNDWTYLVLYAVTAGVAVRIAMFVLPRVSSAHLKSKEAGILAGLTIGVAAIWGSANPPWVVMCSMVLIVLGYAVIKVLNQKIPPRQQ